MYMYALPYKRADEKKRSIMEMAKFHFARVRQSLSASTVTIHHSLTHYITPGLKSISLYLPSAGTAFTDRISLWSDRDNNFQVSNFFQR